MDKIKLKEVLEDIKKGSLSVEDAMDKLKFLPFEDLGYAKIDNHRSLRVGYPEVIYGAGKSKDHLLGIVKRMVENSDNNILITRMSQEQKDYLIENGLNLEYDENPRLGILRRKEVEKVGKIVVATAGTSDLAVAEEAAMTAELFGNQVDRVYDVGVAGIHRLLSNMERLNEASVVVAVAGMEGALASVIGGLVNVPVIAVPTSIGYGASFGGLSALLTMLNSCASGVSVVNIDNGFGAGYLASMINKGGK